MLSRIEIARRRVLWLALLLALAVAGLGWTTSALAQGKSVQQLVASAKQSIVNINVEQGKALMDRGGYVFIDVRDPDEFQQGHVPGAMNVSRGKLEFAIAKAVPDKRTAIVVYCRTGGRGALATQTLAEMGYTNVRNMDGGWLGWVKAGYPAG